MPTYFIMGKFTGQGIKLVKETTQRSERFREYAARFGITVKEIYWLMGEYDVINIVEAPDEETLSALLLSMGSWGNVRTVTCRAYTRGDMDRVIQKMD
ncbi:MAG: GYD domain-containing protein [Nitrospinaceae bacterium]